MTRGARNVYLVCIKEPDPKVLDAIRKLWPDSGHYELSSTQVLVAKPRNGGKSVYERIRDQLSSDFAALVVRFKGFHGYHNPDVWHWLEANVPE